MWVTSKVARIHYSLRARHELVRSVSKSSSGDAISWPVARSSARCTGRDNYQHSHEQIRLLVFGRADLLAKSTRNMMDPRGNAQFVLATSWLAICWPTKNVPARVQCSETDNVSIHPRSLVVLSCVDWHRTREMWVNSNDRIFLLLTAE